MPGKYTATLLLLCSAIPCFADEVEPIKLFSDTFINSLLAYIYFVHVLAIVAFFLRYEWLRVVAGVLYAPVFLIPTGLCFVNFAFALLFLFTGAFFTFTIIIRRK